MRSAVQEVGQRFVVGFDGLTPSAEIRTLIRDFGVGHVVLTARNVAAPEPLAELVHELQGVARQAGHTVPLLVSIEHGGGAASPLGAPWTAWPSVAAIDRLENLELARRMGAALASEMVPFGIHCDFAPSLDVDVAADRDPDKVGRIGASLIEGLQRGGVAACASHFPGEGADDLDWRPFRSAIGSGVAMVMMSRDVLPRFDEELPAMLSPRLVSESLRGRLGFSGVVVASDLCGAKLEERWDLRERTVMAAQAGCDLIRLVEATIETQIEAIEALIRATEGGIFRFTERDDVRRRIGRLKERFLLPYVEPDPRQARRFTGVPQHQALAHEIADRSGVAV